MRLTYDALGQRLHRFETGPGSSHHTLYPSDWAELRDDRLVRLVRGGGPDGVLAEVDATPADPASPQSAALLGDGFGNLAHADPLGASPASPGTRRYEAFGTVRSESGATTRVERGFAGLVPEGRTGLLYARARHYEPETGRFLQPEPMGLFQSNLYSYGANNPIVFSDPSGFAPQLNLSGPPDFLGFDFGDPFFDPLVSPTAIRASLEGSATAQGRRFADAGNVATDAARGSKSPDDAVRDAVLLARGALLLRRTFEMQSIEDFTSSFFELQGRNEADIDFIRFGFIDSLNTIFKRNLDVAVLGGAQQNIDSLIRTPAELLVTKGLPRRLGTIFDVAQRTLGIRTDAGMLRSAQFTCDTRTGSCSGEIVTRIVR